mmetsp:Transcript_22528/g.72835  ORF Transcript_22528/g.72835 Transcript_22528/m.72835 type:complete len:261 (+) Transcript_22528:771-1553(+)
MRFCQPAATETSSAARSTWTEMPGGGTWTLRRTAGMPAGVTDSGTGLRAARWKTRGLLVRRRLGRRAAKRAAWALLVRWRWGRRMRRTATGARCRLCARWRSRLASTGSRWSMTPPHPPPTLPHPRRRLRWEHSPLSNPTAACASTGWTRMKTNCTRQAPSTCLARWGWPAAAGPRAVSSSRGASATPLCCRGRPPTTGRGCLLCKSSRKFPRSARRPRLASSGARRWNVLTPSRSPASPPPPPTSRSSTLQSFPPCRPI